MSRHEAPHDDPCGDGDLRGCTDRCRLWGRRAARGPTADGPHGRDHPGDPRGRRSGRPREPEKACRDGVRQPPGGKSIPARGRHAPGRRPAGLSAGPPPGSRAGHPTGYDAFARHRPLRRRLCATVALAASLLGPDGTGGRRSPHRAPGAAPLPTRGSPLRPVRPCQACPRFPPPASEGLPEQGARIASLLLPSPHWSGILHKWLSGLIFFIFQYQIRKNRLFDPWNASTSL